MKSSHQPHANRYPPIADYGFISDCHSMALVSITGSIDWCVMPRVDAHSVFGRILDWERGGFWQIRPNLEAYNCSRCYVTGTLILETTFKTGDAEVRLYDCLATRAGGRETPHNQLIRIVEGVKGSMLITVALVPRFDYGLLKPWLRHVNNGGDITATGGHQGLLISGDVPLEKRDHAGCFGDFTIREGERRHLSVVYRRPHELDAERIEAPDGDEIERRFRETEKWWDTWSSQAKYSGPYKKEVLQSAVVLKGLTNASTGAIAAAATTSLPEQIGGSRNWDYRFSWVRDSVFTVRSLATLGFRREAERFRRFIERTAAGEASEIQVMFGVGGERYMPEHQLPDLEGYQHSSPVRIGNAASRQLQHDVFGELLHLSYSWHLWGNSPDGDYWAFILQLIERTIEIWRKPDHGIWEVRGKPRHFVHSKAMCWTALDRGIRLAEETRREAPVEKWKAERTAIRDLIEEKGFDKERGVYIQAFGHPHMDASLLLLPIFDFIPYDDERMIRTTEEIQEKLKRDGLIMRYPDDTDGLDGQEGNFLCCVFWLAEVLAGQNRLAEAREVFETACATANGLQLFSEEFDAEKKLMLGNFPQGLSHLSMISAAVAIGEAETRQHNNQE
jgi:GH15 family glucan-1,4-alpha-glucosidase